ncbi:unnamed protein product [Plutella xylostella]|uniref:Probable arginine--tRNA ligase, mitochondrial n=1 Tax=Plutella xylostella TaxID=51655 RepID=A0A8S4D4V3_PLUXY|nr:unnamed protein product [Plutella xylostella]
MCIRLKLKILEKILTNLEKDAIRNYIRNMQVTHKHGTNNFFIDFNIASENKLKKPTINGTDFTNGIKYLQTENENMLRFSINRDMFMKNVIEGINKKPSIHEVGKNIVMDFSSPNIAKPFHVGHLRSTIIGNFIANINRHFNNNVTRINYLGDWGTQFGLLQVGMKAKNISVADLKDNPIRSLYETYVFANKLAATDQSVQDEARKYFANIEQGKTNLESWKQIRDVTVKELQNVYKRLGITFDEYHWESDYNGGAIKDLMSNLEQRNIIRTDELGKKVATYKDRNITVLKSDNSTLYISRDIAALIDRYNKYKFDKMLYVVDNSQTDHFAAVFNLAKQIDEKFANGCEHVKFGRIKGMSTRSGNVVFLNDILDEAKLKMYEKQKESKNTRSSAMDEETCDTLGTTAVIINDLKQRRQKDYTFEWDRALQSEGDSGIKLQYLHCRLWSLESNCGVKLPQDFDPQYLPEPIVSDVIAELAKFEDTLQRSADEYEACILVNYLFRLARLVNRMFNELNVKNVSPELASQRLVVFHTARLVVKSGLEILGVKPLQEM